MNELWLCSLRSCFRERTGYPLGDKLHFRNYKSSPTRNTCPTALHYHSHNRPIFSAMGSSNHTRQRQRSLPFFFPSIVKTLQVFAYTCQKVPLRHSKLCHLNSECRTIHVEDRNQDCIAIPRLRVRQVGQYDDSSAPGPSSPPRACRVIGDVIKGPCRCASGLKVN